MIYKCPGQDRRNIRSETIGCPDCGYSLEIFSDEAKGRCPRCDHMVYRHILPTCVDWCKSARECVGEERWRQVKESKGKES